MSKCGALVLVLLLCSLYAGVSPAVGDPDGTRCEPVEGAPSCVCKTPTGGVIDLTKIANFDGTPRYS